MKNDPQREILVWLAAFGMIVLLAGLSVRYFLTENSSLQFAIVVFGIGAGIDTLILVGGLSALISRRKTSPDPIVSPPFYLFSVLASPHSASLNVVSLGP